MAFAPPFQRPFSGVFDRRATAAATPWYLAGGAIDAGAVAEWVELPTQGQASTCGSLSTAWTVAFTTAWNGSLYQFAFNAFAGSQFVVGLYAPNNGYYTAAWQNVNLFVSGLRHYMIVSNGTSVQAYRDNVAVGSEVVFAGDITGAVYWRTHASYPWLSDLPRGAIYAIGLDATQRTALYASMMAA